MPTSTPSVPRAPESFAPSRMTVGLAVSGHRGRRRAQPVHQPAAGRTAACTGSGFSSSPPAAPAARRWPSSSCAMSGSVASAQLATTRRVGEGCSAPGDARARIPEGSSATRRRSPRRRSWTGSVEGLPVATFPAARALKSRPTSCLAADVVGSVGRARLVIPLGLDYKGVSGPELNCCIAVWYGNAATALFFCFRGLCEIGRDKRSRRARSEPIVTRLGQLGAHLACPIINVCDVWGPLSLRI